MRSRSRGTDLRLRVALSWAWAHERRPEGEDGATVALLVTKLSGSTDAQIRGHLNRGKGERFLKRSDGTWFLRDPENGIDTEEDLPEEE
jgi:hypothetical protein